MDIKGKANIAIILIESANDSPETIKQIVKQHPDLGDGAKVTTYNGPVKGVDQGLWMALLARYGNDRGVDVLSRPFRFSEGNVGSINYAIAKIY